MPDTPKTTLTIDEMIARLRAKIEEQDRVRGRPLNDRERISNLRKMAKQSRRMKFAYADPGAT